MWSMSAPNAAFTILFLHRDIRRKKIEIYFCSAEVKWVQNEVYILPNPVNFIVLFLLFALESLDTLEAFTVMLCG